MPRDGARHWLSIDDALIRAASGSGPLTRGYALSIVVRQALASTVTMLVAIALIALVARVAVERQQERALLALIDTDIAGLTDGMMTGGANEVARRIDDRVRISTLSGSRYRLADARGERIAGDLAAVPALDPARSQRGEVETSTGPLMARATRLRSGYALIVARSLAPSRALIAWLMGLFAWATIPAAALSLVVGGIFARRFGRGVARLNATFDRFESGDHAARTGMAAGSDEIADLARHADRHLARTARLIQAQRGISDNIAHELRTPLGHLDMRLLRALEVTEGEMARDQLHRARSEIRAIVSLFETLLDLALAEGDGPASGRDAMFDLSERMADLAEIYIASAEEAGIAFTTRIAPAVKMRGEGMAMTRAVANLLDNAFKAVPPGSHVRLTVSEGPRVVVEDDGPGIAEGERIDPFERMRASRPPGSGHGLGLALVRVIATRHGLTACYEDARPGARFVLAPDAR